MKTLRCPNKDCRFLGKIARETIIRFGFYRTRWGKRRRYRCQTCEKTFCSNTGTPYYRLQHRRATFDQVATLSVEGLNKSAIARVAGIGWNTVDRWLEKASDCVVASTTKKQPGSKPQSFRPTKSEPLPKVSNSRPGSSQPLRSGPDFGLRLWSADAATTTRWLCFGMLRNGQTLQTFL